MLKQEMIITIGVAGCGKSTWAKKHVAEDKTNMTVRVNKDDLRKMLGVKFSKDNELIVERSQKCVIRQYLSAGYSVIVDNTHLDKKHIQEMREIAQMYEVPMEIKEFRDVPLEVCLERNFARDHGERVPRDVIVNMHKKLEKLEKLLL